jgi:phage terminase large subunit
MKTKKSRVILKQKKLAQKVFQDPLLFATNVLGANLWGREVEILRSIQHHRRTAIKACHGVGKTFTLAHAVLWWLARYDDGIVLTTAPTKRQVETQLWSEIHRVAARFERSFPEINLTQLKFRGEHNFALGLSTNRADNFQGHHGKNLLIIADEAPGLESGIWDAIAGTMAGGKVHVVMAGNPILPAGAFFDAFGRGRELWNCISVDAFDSPNLAGISLEQLLEMDPSEGGPLDQNPVSYLVTRRWVYDQYKVWWHGDERSSPNWMSRVRGQFPDQAQNALIKLAWLERALERASTNPVEDDAPSLIAGVDVGGGEAETVVYLCASKPGQHKIIKMGAWRSKDDRGEVVRFLAPYREHLTSVRVDDIGIGRNFGLHLRDERFPVELVNVSLPCRGRPEWGENDPGKRFVNLKAQFYKTLADAFEHDQIEGLTDDETIGQLADIKYEYDSHGRMKIEPKEKARQRGVRSSDRAEALMLAVGKPTSGGEIILVPVGRPYAPSRRPIERTEAHPLGGFVERSDKDPNDRAATVRRIRKGGRFHRSAW